MSHYSNPVHPAIADHCRKVQERTSAIFLQFLDQALSLKYAVNGESDVGKWAGMKESAARCRVLYLYQLDKQHFGHEPVVWDYNRWT